MNRLQTTAAALIVMTLAVPGCARNRNLPTGYAPSNLTTIGVNSYLWRAAIDTVRHARVRESPIAPSPSPDWCGVRDVNFAGTRQITSRTPQ